jgi:RNA polymerase sigma factor (sigma-70 family)
LSSRRGLPPTEAAELEREYVAHRGAVLAMLRADFGGVPDLEELYQEAWTELLELRARGDRLKSVRGLLKTIAWRRARDRLRKMKPDTLDPMSPALTLEADSEPLPDEQAQIRLDAVVLRQIIDRLDPRQAAVLKLRFDWHLDAREIQERLGVSPKRLEKIVTEAYKNVAAELGSDGAETKWSRKQRSLLLACEMGLASAAQRQRAQQMVDEDATCRAMLREIRSTLRDVAAVLPMPVLFERHAEHAVSAFDRLGDAWVSLKHGVLSLFGRGPGNATALEQAGTAGGAALSGGVAVKAVTACLAVGGGAALCIEQGLLDWKRDEPTRAERRAPSDVTASSPRPERATLVPARTRAKPKRQPAERDQRQRRSRPPTSSPAATPDPSPAPAGSTEFGPGTTGSSAAPTQPAAAPPDGGGEFGP